MLFPVVGWTRDGRVRVDGRTYPLALHGFAWRKRFDVAERRDDYLRLALVDDDETRALYPFAFRFEVEFRLHAGALENNLIVANTDSRPLPYACGLHPPFAGRSPARTRRMRSFSRRRSTPTFRSSDPAGFSETDPQNPAGRPAAAAGA